MKEIIARKRIKGQEDPKYLQAVLEINQIAQHYEEQDVIDKIRASGVKVEVFFDTYYILSMIQGYWEIQISEKTNDIDRVTFRTDRFMAKCLAYFNYIPNIKILLPHAAELKHQLGKTYLLPNERPKKAVIEKFLEEIDLLEFEKLQVENNTDGLRNYLTKLTPRTDDLFKANYILAELDWTRRYKYLFNHSKKPIITFDYEKYDKIEILSSDLFQDLNDALTNKERSRTTVNNLRDAMALCIIRKKIEDYQKSEKNGRVLPIYYVTNDVLKKLGKYVESHFTIPNPLGGRPIGLLKSTEFFILDALFSESNKTDGELFAKFSRLKSNIDLYKNFKIKIPQHEIQQILTTWKKYRNNDFFDKLWNQEDGTKAKLDAYIKNLLAYDFVSENRQSLKNFINEDRELLRTNMDESVNDLVFLEEIWATVSVLKDDLQFLVNKKAPLIKETQSDVFRDEALTRFSPPGGDVEKRIKEFWDDFLAYFDQGEERLRPLKVSLTKMLYEGVLQNKKRDYNKILIGFSILFVFHKYKLILKISEKINIWDGDCAVGYIVIASQIKQDYKSKNDRKKVEEGIAAAERSASFHFNYKSWIAVGYLKFNYWLTRTNGEFKYEIPDVIGLKRVYDHYAKEAIQLTLKALKYLESLTNDSARDDDEKSMYRHIKHNYVLNNYVYYITCAGDDEQFAEAEFEKYYEKLVRLMGGDSDYRQPRFNDTIASYNYRLAKTSLSNKSKAKFLKTALKYTRAAMAQTVLIDNHFHILHEKIDRYLVKVENDLENDKKVIAEYKKANKKPGSK